MAFLTENDASIGYEFKTKGYVVKEVFDQKALSVIENTLFEIIEKHVGSSLSDRSIWLDKAHEFISVDALNDFRLNIINNLNNCESTRFAYFNLARPYLEALVGNELAMQRRINLSIQLPKDDSSLLPVHADTWSGDSPFEAVVWVPLVDCYGTKTMYLLPPDKTKLLEREFATNSHHDSEHLFSLIEKDVEWLTVKRGQVLIFNQTLPHGNRVNMENETRWSMNCRFKGIFTPTADKKLGEFFEPITLRPMSEIGLGYKLPKIQ